MGKHPWKVAELLAEAKKAFKTAVKTGSGGKQLEDAGTKETQDTETSKKAKKGKKGKHKKDQAKKNKTHKKKEAVAGPHARRRGALPPSRDMREGQPHQTDELDRGGDNDTNEEHGKVES